MREVAREQHGEFSVLHRPADGTAQATVHFAHATGFNAETYRRLIEALDPSVDVYAMDARGHGFSKAPADPRSLRSWRPFCRDLTAFIDALARPIVLAGHSMGATVSMQVAAARPDLVRGIVLIDPVITPPRYVFRLGIARFFGLSQRLIPIAAMAAKRRMEFASREAAVDNYLGKGPFKTWKREWIEDYVAGGTVPAAGGGVRLSCERRWEAKTFAVATVNPYRALRRIRCPITLLTREHDAPPFTRASRDAVMHIRPDTRLLVLDGATHFLAMEQPETTQEEIERMVRKVLELR